MYIESNQVLSRIFALNGLKFNEKGLFYPMHNTEYDFFITNDLAKICKLIDLNHLLIAEANYEEFFNMVCESKYFFKSKFTEDASKGECKILGLMAEFLQNNEVVSKTRLRLQLTELFTYFKEEDFGNKYHKIVYILANKEQINKKFSGGVILSLRPDYDKRNLSTTMPFFKDNIGMDKVDYEYFILTSTLEEIVAKFEEVTNHLIK